MKKINFDGFLYDPENNYAKVSFNKSLYTKEILFEVAGEFLDNLYVVFNEAEEYYILTFFKKGKDDFKEAFFEFLNYLLGMTVSKLKE